ncbi:MAG: biotin/lipoyl-containing protein, partial [Candidatus Poseidoniaceae archaeon]
MTDKATVEIPAPCDGTVTKIIGDAGDILPVGVVCIEFEVDGDGNASASEPELAAPAVEEAPEPVADPEPAPTPEPTPAPEPVSVAGPVVERAAGTKP